MVQPTTFMRPTFIVLLFIFAVTIAGVATCPVPWSAGLAGVALGSGVAAWSARGSGVKLALVHLAAVCLALAAFEGYLARQARIGDGTRMEGTIIGDFTGSDDEIGYRPHPGQQVTARKLHGDTLIYDVTYSIGEDGRRVMPPADPASAGCVVFFGDSVTFGEGVEDNESYPFVAARWLGGSYAAHNLAFSGYGPQQMLALLQGGVTTRLDACRPAHFVYLAILEHVARVAGLTNWDKHGPRFRLDEQGYPVRDGNFDTLSMPARAVNGYLTWQRFFGRARTPGDSELELFVAVVTESARLARERHAGSTFQVILWDGRDDDRLDVIERRLVASGIGVHRLTSAIPDFAVNADRYLLGPHDGHPNPLMHRLLGEYVADVMITRRGPATPAGPVPSTPGTPY